MTHPQLSSRLDPVLSLPPPAPRPDPDLHSVSPRRFAEFTYELYLCGLLSWAEYRLVGFPSELDPRFDATIGALIGERAEPDRKRDMLAEWQRRVEFMTRYQTNDPATGQAGRVLAVLLDHAGEANNTCSLTEL